MSNTETILAQAALRDDILTCAIVNTMCEWDMFDFLADSGADPSREQSRNLSTLREAMFVHLSKTGSAPLLRWLAANTTDEE